MKEKEGKRHSCIALQLYSFISCEHLFIENFLVFITSIVVVLSNCFTYPPQELGSVTELRSIEYMAKYL